MKNDKEIKRLLKMLHQKVVSKFQDEYISKEAYGFVFGIEYKVKKNKTIKAYHKITFKDIMDKHPLYFRFTRHTQYHYRSIKTTGSFMGVNLELIQQISHLTRYADITTLGHYPNYDYHRSKEVEKVVSHQYRANLKGFETDIAFTHGEDTVKGLLKYIEDPSSMSLIIKHRCSVASIVPSSQVTSEDEVLDIETSNKPIAQLMRDMRKVGVDIRESYKEIVLVKNTGYSPSSAKHTLLAYREYKDKLTLDLTEGAYNKLARDSYKKFLKLMIKFVDSLDEDMREQIKW
jgi:hypothetical protein